MTAQLNMIRGRSNVVTLTNNSGGALIAGDVCVQDTSADEKVTTTTSAASTLKVFVAAESIASGAAGKFYESGYCPLVNVNASVTRGRFLFTHTVAKQAAENASYGSGAFGKILKSGTTPSAIIYSATAQISSSGVTRSGSTTDAHLAVWNGSNADSIKDGGVVPAGSDTPWRVELDATLPAHAQSGFSTLVLDPNNHWPEYVQSDGNQNSYIEFKVLLGAGTWDFYFRHVKNNNSGIFTVSIDGGSIGTADAYNGSLAWSSSTLSSVSVADTGGSALHLLRFTMATKNGSSSNYYGQLNLILCKRTA